MPCGSKLGNYFVSTSIDDSKRKEGANTGGTRKRLSVQSTVHHASQTDGRMEADTSIHLCCYVGIPTGRAYTEGYIIYLFLLFGQRDLETSSFNPFKHRTATFRNELFGHAATAAT